MAANPETSEVAPIRILGAAHVPLMFESDSKVSEVQVRVVEDRPYAFVPGSEYFNAHRSTFDFGAGKGFRPVSGTPWVLVSLLVITDPPSSCLLCAARHRFASPNDFPFAVIVA